MKRLLLPLALAATAALLWQSVTPAQACSCIAPSGDAATYYVSNASLVLVGTITDLVATEEMDQPDFDVRVSVDAYIKGSGPTEIVADDPIGGGDCGMFDASYVGKRYVLFFWDAGPGFRTEFRTGLCSGNTPASEDFIRRVEAAVGVSPTTPTTREAPTIPLAIAAVALPLVFVLAASFVFPARGSRP